jgi:hypothetical protein
MDMDIGPKRFFANWSITVIGLAILIALFDGLIDPYLVFGMPRAIGINARKPAADTQQYLMKAYDVTRAEPLTLLLGSSRIEVGIDTRNPAWPAQDRPIYNLGLSNGTAFVAYRYLQHVTAQRHVSLVLLGIEFSDFIPAATPKPPEFEARLNVKRDGSENDSQRRQHLGDVLTATLSLDALVDSAETVLGNLTGDSSDIVAGDWNFRFFRHITDESGSYPMMAWSDSTFSFFYRRGQVDLRPMEDLRAILELCQKNGIRVIAFINPSHADELELFDLSGRWPALEDWKRTLVSLFAPYEARRTTPVELWDFCGYDTYSSEPVRKSLRPLQWFWNTSHYTRALGTVVLGQILGTNDAHVGMQINPANIEARLAQVREQRRRYRELHPDDLRRVRDIYNLVLNEPPG